MSDNRGRSLGAGSGDATSWVMRSRASFSLAWDMIHVLEAVGEVVGKFHVEVE